jgi:endonuclease-3 related protein
MSFPTRKILLKVYQAMLKTHGYRHWWPGDTPFEIMVGAILTQNTAWKNVEKTIAGLKKEKLLSISGIRKVPLAKLAKVIRPSGYFNQKAKKLKGLVRHMDQEYSGSLKRMKQQPLPALREKLLEVWGIGPETADSILLYALEKPVFVVDTYTKRILLRHRWIPASAGYSHIQQLLTCRLPKEERLYNDYHAQLVAVGNRYCKRSQALCEQCPLQPYLPER